MKYTLTRKDGKPIPETAKFFVLRIDNHGKEETIAAQSAVLHYAETVLPIDPDASAAAYRSLHNLPPESSTRLYIQRMSLIRRLVELANREHYNCEEDTFYGCPLSRDGCSNDSIPKECNCGADAHNAEVAAIASKLGIFSGTKPNG